MDPNKEQLPLYFSSAEKWPGKIHEPLDQGNCAASWAFSTAGTPVFLAPPPHLGPPPSSGPATSWKKFRISPHGDSCVFSLLLLLLLSRGIRQNLHPVDGSHDPSAVAPEPHIVRHPQPGRLRGRPGGRSLVVPASQRVKLLNLLFILFTVSTPVALPLSSSHPPLLASFYTSSPSLSSLFSSLFSDYPTCKLLSSHPSSSSLKPCQLSFLFFPSSFCFPLLLPSAFASTTSPSSVSLLSHQTPL